MDLHSSVVPKLTGRPQLSLKSQYLSFAEGQVCHISAVVNSRPLVSISKNPADLDVLAPAHFLNSGQFAFFVDPRFLVFLCGASLLLQVATPI